MTKTIAQTYPWIAPDGKPTRFSSVAAVLTRDDRVELDVDLARQLLANVDIPIRQEALHDGGVEIIIFDPLLSGAGDNVEEAIHHVKHCFEYRSWGFYNVGCDWEEAARILKLQIAWRDDNFEDVILEALEKSSHARKS